MNSQLVCCGVGNYFSCYHYLFPTLSLRFRESSLEELYLILSNGLKTAPILVFRGLTEQRVLGWLLVIEDFSGSKIFVKLLHLCLCLSQAVVLIAYVQCFRLLHPIILSCLNYLFLVICVSNLMLFLDALMIINFPNYVKFTYVLTYAISLPLVV